MAVSYADVIRFYAMAEGGEPCEKDSKESYCELSENINKVKKIVDKKSFEHYLQYVVDNNIYALQNRIKAELSRDDEKTDYMRSNIPIQGQYYYFHKERSKAKYDNYVFAWLLFNRRDWMTVKIFNDINQETDFYSWFIGCCERKDPGQKWHLFQYILFHEMNSKYNFSELGKATDLETEEFTYYIGRAQCLEFMLWMAEWAGLSEMETAKVKVKDMSNKDIKPGKICAELRKILPWSEIENRIKEGIVKNA